MWIRSAFFRHSFKIKIYLNIAYSDKKMWQVNSYFIRGVYSYKGEIKSKFDQTGKVKISE